MDYNTCFTNLDEYTNEYTKTDDISETNCCDDINNYLADNGVITCKSCSNTITNIVNADIKSSAAIAFSKMADLTASRALVSDGSGDVSASSVTSTTLGFVDATSSIQTQLDTKASVGFAIAQAVALG